LSHPFFAAGTGMKTVPILVIGRAGFAMPRAKKQPDKKPVPTPNRCLAPAHRSDALLFFKPVRRQSGAYKFMSNCFKKTSHDPENEIETKSRFVPCRVQTNGQKNPRHRFFGTAKPIISGPVPFIILSPDRSCCRHLKTASTRQSGTLP